MVVGSWIALRDIGRREVGSVTYVLLAELDSAGWRLRRQGHKFTAYCPCGDAGAWVRIDGTPRSEENQARRVRRLASHCPSRHDLD